MPIIYAEGADSQYMAWIRDRPEFENLSFAKNARVCIFDDGSTFDENRFDLAAILKTWHRFLKMNRAVSVMGGLFDSQRRFYLLTDNGEVTIS